MCNLLSKGQRGRCMFRFHHSVPRARVFAKDFRDFFKISEGLGHFPTSNFQPTHRRTGGRKYGKGYSFPMLATKLYPLLPTTPGTANLTNFPKRKTPQSATFQSLYINKNERTLFPRFVVVGFLYSFCSSRQDFQIFFAHTVKHSIELTAARGFLLFPFREKELVY